MVKPTTPQVVRFSPLVSVLKTPKKGGVAAFVPQSTVSRHPSRGTRTTRTNDTRRGDTGDLSALYRELDGIEQDDIRKARKGDPMDEDDPLDWDEETTLAAMFEDKDVDVDEREELAALAEQLKEPMNAEAQKLRQHLRNAVIPAMQRIKEVHDKMEDEVDVSFGTGILAFDDACKGAEAKAIRDEDELKTAYRLMKALLFPIVQRNTEKLVGELQDAYHRREQLWATFEADLEQTGILAS
ncbi:hypothetical protein EIP91_005295 [Steccherinum ochraceum]|uniref:Uncharacterized protein n=1 Tax=Steccherinum ochraceum TaxID=92696 RepID=A0A4R0RFS3_9APHY|nr:hypothetical protein EIP91_005295 [Steccherinum ochraceum]